MSRLFITQRELNFISDITKELIKDVVGQRIFYFPISEIKTRTHELYQESPEKIFDNPIEIEALIESPAGETKVALFGPERLKTINVFLQYHDLIDRKINVSIGDFIRYGDVVYEISKYTEIRNIYGQVENLDGIKLECTQARLGQFNTKQLGPSDTGYSDKDAIQTEFTQQRGRDQIDDVPTGDERALQKNGVLDPPINGPARVNNKPNDPAGPGFYDES